MWLLYVLLVLVGVPILIWLIRWLKKRMNLSLTQALTIVKALEKRKLSDVSISKIAEGHLLKWEHGGLSVSVTIRQMKGRFESLFAHLVIDVADRPILLIFENGDLEHGDDANLRRNALAAQKALLIVGNKIAELSQHHPVLIHS